MKNCDRTEDIENELARRLQPLGLFVFGWFVMPDAPFAGRKAALIGNRAENGQHKMWETFRQSPEHDDGFANPMDRWSERVIGKIAVELEAVALHPFGETLWPFQRYAKAATGMQSSPLGLLIHPEFGLWHAFRAILVFHEHVVLDVPRKPIHACDSCDTRPCLSACPVEAFSAEGFLVRNCRSHLSSGKEPDCMSDGCRARAACPVGVPYPDEQIRFHMMAFAGN